MMELDLYHFTLLVTGIVNLTMAAALLYGNNSYRDYAVYRRSRLLTAVFFGVFGIGFLMHYWFQWRTEWPLAATALSVTYFHIGGVAITWSHTSLLNPNYLSRQVVIRDLSILIIGVVTYWMFWLPVIFLLHAAWMAFSFYRTYYRVSNRLIEMKLGTIEGFIHWMLLSCHLIILFGIGSIVFTALLPTAVWPYTVLLCIGMAVFIYIFYSLSEYGTVIESATNATEDAAERSDN